MNKIREYTNCCLELADFAMPSILIGTAGSLLANRILKYSPNVFVLAVAFSVSHLCNRYKYMDLKELAKGIKHITKNPKDFVSTWTIKKMRCIRSKGLDWHHFIKHCLLCDGKYFTLEVVHFKSSSPFARNFFQCYCNLHFHFSS